MCVYVQGANHDLMMAALCTRTTAALKALATDSCSHTRTHLHMHRLTEAAEKAKIELSSLTQTSVNLPFITATADGPKHIDTTLTRAK